MDITREITREEAIANLNMISVAFVEPVTEEQRKLIDDTFDIAIKALEQEPDDFARWVATEIFDDMWKYNKDAFAEIACRKLAKLGIVRAKGDEWELIEPQGSEG